MAKRISLLHCLPHALAALKHHFITKDANVASHAYLKTNRIYYEKNHLSLAMSTDVALPAQMRPDYVTIPEKAHA